FVDERAATKETYRYDDGLRAYLQKIVAEQGQAPLAGEVFTIHKEQDGLHLDCALAWTEATEERVLSYVNSIPTISGGAHENGLHANRTVGDAIASRVVLAARARSASRAAAAEVQRKGAVSHRLNLPGKLADCSSTDPSECELFIVEGDSAGGSAKQGRDRAFQAILPLRGKVLNTEQASTAKVLTNKELSDLVSALGCGTGKDFD